MFHHLTLDPECHGDSVVVNVLENVCTADAVVYAETKGSEGTQQVNSKACPKQRGGNAQHTGSRDGRSHNWNTASGGGNGMT